MKHHIIWLLLGSVVWTASLLPAEEPLHPQWRVELTVEKPNLILGEPLIANIVVHNDSNQERHLIAGRNGVATIQISRDGKQYKVFVPFLSTFDSRSPVLIRAGQKRQEQRVVLCGSKGWAELDFAFPETGQYWVRASIQDTGVNNAETPALAIKIEEPRGGDLTLWKQLQELKLYAALIQYPDFGWSKENLQALAGIKETAAISQDPEAIDRIPALIRDHPASIYSHHLALALAKSFQHASYNSTNREAARQKAFEYFEVASQMTQVPAVREDALLALGKLVDAEKRIALAEQAAREFPNSRHRETWQKLVARAEFDKHPLTRAAFRAGISFAGPDDPIWRQLLTEFYPAIQAERGQQDLSDEAGQKLLERRLREEDSRRRRERQTTP